MARAPRPLTRRQRSDGLARGRAPRESALNLLDDDFRHWRGGHSCIILADEHARVEWRLAIARNPRVLRAIDKAVVHSCHQHGATRVGRARERAVAKRVEPAWQDDSEGERFSRCGGSAEQHEGVLGDGVDEAGNEGWVELEGAAPRRESGEATVGAEGAVGVGKGRAVRAYSVEGIERRGTTLKADAQPRSENFMHAPPDGGVHAGAAQAVVAQQKPHDR
mmetsp:Transcript_12588/g.38456  ORF Transcript_12588/g.38456 Transcript_12588/m.38456 type:complete len:221 (-) Transcript_12588:152-814(-)|eukprot:scaffold68282_cov28-Tisochrysis_lutea.AAC.3